MVSGLLARNGALEVGWVEVRGDRIVAVANGPPPRAPDVMHDGIVAPGLCDLQVNGAGGHQVVDGNSGLDAIDTLQLAHGVTTYLPTVVSTDDATAARTVAELEERAADPSSPVAGVHLEGPFLNPDHAGTHRVERLRVPADGMPAYFSSPAVRLVTLAPELPGALALTAELHARGVAVSLGHSAAPADVVRLALDAGARCVTHVFNAMGPLHHRRPGLAGVALTDARAAVCVIADGHHLDPVVLELIRRAAGRRVVLVSDASPAAAAPPGRYTLAGVEVESSEEGGVRNIEGRLAGSALTLDQALANWVALTGASIAEAIAAASEGPAAVLGLHPGLHPGCCADIVLLDGSGVVQRVMRRGRWLS